MNRDDNLIIRPGDQGSSEITDAGLVVPKGTKEKRRRVIPNQDWKLWRRSFKSQHAAGVAGYFVCEECKTPMLPQEKEKSLECDCTRWELPGFERLVIVKGKEDE